LFGSIPLTLLEVPAPHTHTNNNPLSHYGEAFAELVQDEVGKDDMAD
jgi:hypothetical protein